MRATVRLETGEALAHVVGYEVLGLPGDRHALIEEDRQGWELRASDPGTAMKSRGFFATPADALAALQADQERLRRR